MNLFDYIYADVQKIISVYSQLTGGVVEARESMFQNSDAQDNKRKYDFRIFKHDAGGTKTDSESLKEVIKPHHSLYTELEEELEKQGHLLDISDPAYKKDLTQEENRLELKQRFCIKVTGRCVIEDYERIKNTSESFPKIVELVNRSNESNLRKSEAYLATVQRINSEKEQLNTIHDNRERSRVKNSLKQQEIELEKIISQATRLDGVEEWILAGLRTWINAYLPGIINLRVYPKSQSNTFHVFGHMKKENFFDSDTNAIHFTYGSLPTEEITLIGIVTSVPGEMASENFDPMAEFAKESLTDTESVESAFRGMFRGFDGIEAMIRTLRFPRVLVHPLLVYRKAIPKTGKGK